MGDADLIWISVFFVILSLILLVVLTFLYKLTLAVGRLDRRLEQLARHLRDLNLYELHPNEMDVVFGQETEAESAVGGSSDTSTMLPPKQPSSATSSDALPYPDSGIT